MFALIFIWTPPHFWALALFMRSDYDDAGIPMLTVTHGRPSTRRHILGYTIVLFALAVGTSFTSIGGPIYLLAALVLNTLFLKGAYDIWNRDEAASEVDDYAVERKFLNSHCFICSCTLVRFWPRRCCVLGDWVAGNGS